MIAKEIYVSQYRKLDNKHMWARPNLPRTRIFTFAILGDGIFCVCITTLNVQVRMPTSNTKIALNWIGGSYLRSLLFLAALER